MKIKLKATSGNLKQHSNIINQFGLNIDDVQDKGEDEFVFIEVNDISFLLSAIEVFKGTDEDSELIRYELIIGTLKNEYYIEIYDGLRE